MSDQPMPTVNDHPPVLEIALSSLGAAGLSLAKQEAVAVALRERDRIGRERYGTSLQPFNGRDSRRDLLEELLDGILYATQRCIEVEATGNEQERGLAAITFKLLAAMAADWLALK